MKRIIKNFIWWVCRHTLYRNRSLYFQDHYNSISFIHLVLFNVFYPGRSLNRIRYNRLRIGVGWKSNNKIEHIVDYSEGNPDKSRAAALSSLEINGVVVLRNYFNRARLQEFRDRYRPDVKAAHEKNPEGDCIVTGALALSDVLVNIWMDEYLLDLMKGYLKRMPVARNYPNFTTVNPRYKDGKLIKGTSLATKWHLDHSTIIQPAVYLSDVPETGSTTQVIQGTHRLPALALGNLSHEYVIQNKLKVLSCHGAAGSVQIHDGNAFHRLRPAEGHSRDWIKFEYSSGPNILFDFSQAADTLRDGFDLDQLSTERRRILFGLYPVTPFKGFQLEEDYLTPTKFKGI